MASKPEKKEMSLVEKIAKIRHELSKSELKKTGKNPHQNFNYFELGDFLPKINELNSKHGITDIFEISEDYAKLTLIDSEKNLIGDFDKFEFKIPFKYFEVPISKQGKKQMQEIQYLGAVNSYYKRYLYMNAYAISESDIIDNMDNSQTESKPKKVMTELEKKTKELQNLLELNLTEDEKTQFLKEQGLTKKSNVKDFQNAIDTFKKLGNIDPIQNSVPNAPNIDPIQNSVPNAPNIAQNKAKSEGEKVKTEEYTDDELRDILDKVKL